MSSDSNIDIMECERTVEVSDNFKTLRYKINFHVKNTISRSYDIIPNYIVEVVNFVREIPLVIYEKAFDTLEDAQNDFERNVQLYKAFVQTQVRPLDDINLYKEKIGYQVQLPNCCLTCRHCRISKDRRSLECHNYQNFAFLQVFDPEKDQKRAFFGHEPDGMKRNPGEIPYGNEDFGKIQHNQFLNIHPKVDNLGICRNFESRKPEDALKNPEMVKNMDKEIYRQVVNNIDRRVEGLEHGEVWVDCGDSVDFKEIRDKEEAFDDRIAIGVDKRLQEYRDQTGSIDINGNG